MVDLETLSNPYRGSGLPAQDGLACGAVLADPATPLSLLRRCPAAATTPLRDLPGPAAALGVGGLTLKDERERMGLGSFKALGAAYAIAHEAAGRGGDGELAGALEGVVYACASAGNHGLSVAAGARVFGARAVIYLGDGVPEAFAGRLREYGAVVARPGGDYEATMEAVARDAAREGWILLSDSSWPGYVNLPTRVMEGYLVMGEEVRVALDRPPTHILLQAGVGGMAAAMSAFFRAQWGDAPVIVVVEPTAAPALLASIRAGRPVAARGPASSMGRLDCKQPSHLALIELARSADWFVTVSDRQCEATVEWLAGQGLATTPSGAAGVAALQHVGDCAGSLGLSGESRVLAFLSEGPEDPS